MTAPGVSGTSRWRCPSTAVKTWHRARVAGHDGRYDGVFTAPPGALVTLRTSAADAAGGTVTETITSGYRTGR